MKYLAIVYFIGAFWNVDFAQTNDPYLIFNQSNAIISKAHNMWYCNHTQERIGGKMVKDYTMVKVNRQPYKMYLIQYKDGGSEVLYNATTNKDKVVVNPGIFPYLTLKLSPFCSFLRKSSHHTIFRADLQYSYQMIAHILNCKSQNTHFTYQGEEDIEHKKFYVLNLEIEDYKKLQYLVKPKEDLVRIANRLFLSDYKILELNPSLSYYDDVDAGDLITITNYYAKKFTLYIDQITHLPYIIKVYDEKGLFESYLFSDFKVDAPLSDIDFSEKNPQYGF